MKKYLLTLALLGLIFCGLYKTVGEPSIGQAEVVVEFSALDEWKDSVKLKVPAGSSALDATIEALGEIEVPFEKTGFGDFAYLASINGYREKQVGSYSGWLYEVNGEEASVGSAQYKIEEDLTISWEYSTSE